MDGLLENYMGTNSTFIKYDLYGGRVLTIICKKEKIRIIEKQLNKH